MLALLLDMNLPQASSVAPAVDRLYDFIYYFSLLSFVGIVGAMLYFVIRYHRRRSDPDLTPYIEGHPIAESSVMLGLFVVVMIMFYWGWVDYKKMITPPPHSLEINLLGKQWLWEFEYTNGRKMVNEVVVPKDRPITLLLSSADVLHSFYVPAFRIKQDLVPGSYTRVWFTPTQVGEFQVFCAEYCGTAHSSMLAKVKVVEPEAYEKWQKKWEWEKQLGLSSSPAEKAPAPGAEAKGAPPASTESPAERGAKVFSAKGCNACHTVTGTPSVGPSLKGIFGHEVELEGGKKVTADENYIRQSIVEPNGAIVKGFQPIMPTFKGSLTDDEMNSLIAYIKSLGN